MNNEEKILELLLSIQQGVSDLTQRVDHLESDVSVLKDDSQFIKGVVVRMENEHGKKLDALFDGYSSNFEIINRYDSRVSKLEREVEKLSFEVKYLKAAR